MMGLWFAYRVGRRRSRRECHRRIRDLEDELYELERARWTEHNDRRPGDSEPDVFEAIGALIQVVFWIAIAMYILSQQ